MTHSPDATEAILVEKNEGPYHIQWELYNGAARWRCSACSGYTDTKDVSRSYSSSLNLSFDGLSF